MKRVLSFPQLLPIRKFVIQEKSMEPTYYQGDTVLVYSWFNIFKKNDIIVFADQKTEKTFIKRIKQINEGEILVEGDNKNMSIDSRHFGPIKMEQIIGRVIAKL
ncbi:hypothetical protein BH11PAT1_BH11PAT1_0590 [soil metagenome]